MMVKVDTKNVTHFFQVYLHCTLMSDSYFTLIKLWVSLVSVCHSSFIGSLPVVNNNITKFHDDINKI